jgi:NADH:ubiquinone oxidoreductase subunit 5 (subunit L)/multisubunit Na+/H+ antiporter MnhA subunit
MIVKNRAAQLLNTTINYLLWVLFIANLTYLVSCYPNVPEWCYKDLLKINSFTLLIWILVTFFSALISSFAKKYLKGFNYHTKFSLLCLGFTGSIMVFVMANQVLILLMMWGLMGVFMSQLIGVDSRWGEAREASKFALRYFAAGSLFLSAGVLVLAFQTGDFTLSGILSKLNNCIAVHDFVVRFVHHYCRNDSIGNIPFSSLATVCHDCAYASFGFNACRICKRFGNFINAIRNGFIRIKYADYFIYYWGFNCSYCAIYETPTSKCEAKTSLFNHCPNGFYDYAMWFGVF